LNFLDYVLITVVGLSMVLSLWRGFVREVISLIGLVTAFLVASHTSSQVSGFLGAWITSHMLADIMGFLLVFTGIIIMVGLISALIRKLMKKADVTATDRLLGLFFGLARGVLLISLCFLVYTSYAAPDRPWLKNSVLTPYALELADLMGRAIPENYLFSRRGGKPLPSPQKMRSQVSSSGN